MTLVVQHHDKIRPDFLFELMERQRLLPEWVAGNPTILVGLSDRARISTVSEGEDIYLLVVESINVPGVMDILVFIMNKDIIRRKDEVSACQDQLRAHWFANGIRRVQASIPTSRKNTKRILLYLGFVQETRDCGIRDLMKYGPKLESCLTMGLLPSDPCRAIYTETEVAHG